ncbi:unnamed protein product [Arabis nemorensis]|uniref:Protein kinase domain-containing protein n=1 Tax=Arabis nemorensis TaxID=586526 RepID=A0A565CI98_9BRAS|nr:unnamed protein product [Arabis nemorensis]
MPTDDELSLSDLDMVKVLGKGSSGVVQLVQHKWTSQFFTLKSVGTLEFDGYTLRRAARVGNHMSPIWNIHVLDH